ncbi:MAG TPA: leishmanolysin-related zinc metalloendopeptidase [Gemmatimonadaceae bacterium]|nr:leishmanolysin-related zinc metalloendopeptidase [Gemmatimonadaceae bacterium]
MASLAGCGGADSPTGADTPRPTTIEIVTSPSGTSAAGLPLSAAPTFQVKDQNGAAMGGVAVSVSVTAGGGSVAGTPSATASAGPTPVGTWTLGRAAGANVLTIGVSGLTPQTITVNGVAGAAAKLTAVSTTTLAGTVAAAVSPAPSARVTDAYDNPIPGASVAVNVSGGGTTSAASLTTDAQGVATASGWTLGTVKGTQSLTLTSGGAAAVFTAEAAADVPASIVLAGGGGQSAFGGRAVSPVVFAVRDRFDNGVGNRTVTFSATGGGALSAASATTGDDGTLVAPAWTLGKSVVPQQLRATSGALSATADAAVRSDFNITVRFFGAPMTAAQQALFTNAAARISAIITGDIPNVDATGFDLDARCGVTGQPVMSEVIDDVVIYANIGAIDGAGKVLAQAGPCGFRSSAGGSLPAIGVMEFDDADLASLAGAGSLQDVIMHEMMHVLGFGDSYFDLFHFLANYNTSMVAFTGPRGLAGCRGVGGTTTCASSVPLENSGGDGTANSHWRESVFRTELMTGFANSGAMPISAMTVGAFEDLGYQVNYDARDGYAIPGGSLRAAGASTDVRPQVTGDGWERGPARSGTVIAAPGIFQTLPPRGAGRPPRLTAQ